VAQSIAVRSHGRRRRVTRPLPAAASVQRGGRSRKRNGHCPGAAIFFLFDSFFFIRADSERRRSIPQPHAAFEHVWRRLCRRDLELAAARRERHLVPAVFLLVGIDRYIFLSQFR